MNPATPVKEPAPEILSLVTEEFPEEDETLDPEYRPELEPPLRYGVSYLVSRYGTVPTVPVGTAVRYLTACRSIVAKWPNCCLLVPAPSYRYCIFVTAPI